MGVDFIGLAEGLTPEQLAIAQVNQNTEISVASETVDFTITMRHLSKSHYYDETPE